MTRVTSHKYGSCYYSYKLEPCDDRLDACDIGLHCPVSTCGFINGHLIGDYVLQPLEIEFECGHKFFVRIMEEKGGLYLYLERQRTDI